MLKELDRSHLAGTFAGDHLKKFHPRQQLCLGRTPDLNQEIVLNLKDFLHAVNDGDLSDVPNNFADN